MKMTRSNHRSKAVAAGGTALLIIDLISDFEFEDGDRLLESTLPMAKTLSKFRNRAKSAGIPVIYVNDNFGKWKEDFRSIIRRFSKPGAKGKEVVRLLKPDHDDFYILKPHRSAFYSTSLMLLLENLGVKRLIITGVTTDICILFSANDAYMRGFKLFVPEDCVTAVEADHTTVSLDFIDRVLKADTRPSTAIEFNGKHKQPRH